MLNDYILLLGRSVRHLPSDSQRVEVLPLLGEVLLYHDIAHLLHPLLSLHPPALCPHPRHTSDWFPPSVWSTVKCRFFSMFAIRYADILKTGETCIARTTCLLGSIKNVKILHFRPLIQIQVEVLSGVKTALYCF